MKKGKSSATPAMKPTLWVIVISADPKTGKLNYRDPTDPTGKVNRERIFPSNGDTIQWKLGKGIQKQPFQISFSEISPFNGGSPASYRGNGKALSDPVQFPTNFQGSRLCKYTVTLSNGWSDDPDVVPVPPDTLPRPFDAPQIVVCLIAWHLDNGTITGIDLTPNNVASRAYQPVDWKWADSQPAPTQDFTLHFDNQVPGWPKDSGPDSEIILTPGAGQSPFTIAIPGFPPKGGNLTVAP